SPGDMIVEVQVQTPTKLTKQQKTLLREFAEHSSESQEECFFSRLFHSHFSQTDKKQHAGDA
ncbi:MAG: molecular chaperone DnaJ, partial [Desulfobulbaceae bacterium]|nr:molecular chaperone DnaJ [Desulfobulbaceae bacterium]